jgi:UDP-GlcNAc:undecaprenyl-phosphate GlcNAc-1-phosphate transferase
MDSLTVARGVFFGTVAAQLVILYVYRFSSYSRTVFAMYGVLLLIAVTLSRASFRLAGELVQRHARRSGKRIVIYGAGDGGSIVLRELLSQGAGDLRILGFIDDDPRKAGIRVSGYQVLGGHSALGVLVKAASVDAVIVSARAMQPERLNNLEVLCSESGIQLSRLHIAIESIVEVDDAPVERTGIVRQFKP